ncbi:MAG: nucleotide exchange factor GrpE [Calditrichaeota bacterium]|nr:nucleotide exchange factor GrpE [Calditrichota bacterium]
MSKSTGTVVNDANATTVKEATAAAEKTVPTGTQTAAEAAAGKTSQRKKPRSKTQQLQEENQQLKERIQQLEDQLIRLTADMQNLKKRYDRELENVVIYGNQKFVEKLLPLVDELERALHMSDQNKNFEAFRNGIELIYKKFLKILEDEGVKPIKAVGQKFDYNLHDAILMAEREGVESGTILEEVQKGYFYKDRVLRHAKVIVAK